MDTQISVLGEFKLLLDNSPVSIKSKKARALLVYLACNSSRMHSRESVASLLWSHCDEKLARSNLRQALAQIRKNIRETVPAPELVVEASDQTGERSAPTRVEDPVNFLATKSERLSLDVEHLHIDVLKFRQLSRNTDLASLEEANGLYQGELWAGRLLGEPKFDEWLENERRVLSECQFRVLSELLGLYEERSILDKSVETARKLLKIDPYQERIHRSLMRTYHKQGRRNSVLTQFNECCKLLKQDLSAEPENETRELFVQLQNGRAIVDSNQENGKEVAEPSQIDNSGTTAQGSRNTRQSNGQATIFVPGNVASSNKRDTQRSTFASKQLRLVKRIGSLQPRTKLALFALFLLSTFIVVNQFSSRTADDTVANVERTEVAQDSQPRLAELRGMQSSGKPAIAVLPFSVVGGKEDQAYFGNGLSEDLTTELARLSGLTVVAPYSTFSVSADNLEVSVMARKLNVDYLLRGSVQKERDNLRVYAILLQGSTGKTLWSEKYDRKYSELFDLQDDLTRSIVAELAVELTNSEQKHFDRLKTIDMDAYDLVLRGLEPLRRFTFDGLVEARGFFQQALDIDPGYARAHANVALTHGTAIVFRLSTDPERDISLGMKHIANAEALDDGLPQIYFAKAVIQLAARNHDAAIEAARRSIKLEPSYADGYAVLAQTLGYAGDLPNALVAIREGIRLSPVTPFSYLWVEAHTLYLMEEYSQALDILNTVVERNPSFLQGQLLLSATYSKLGMHDDSEWHRDEALAINPEFSADLELAQAPYRKDAHRHLFAGGLEKAGFPK